MVQGQVQLSRNGRYALQFGSTNIYAQTALLDLQTGARTKITEDLNTIASSRQAVSGAGMVVYTWLDGLRLWTAGSSKLIATPEPAGGSGGALSYLSNAIIDAQGNVSYPD